jgi:hypothetical protein
MQIQKPLLQPGVLTKQAAVHTERNLLRYRSRYSYGYCIVCIQPSKNSNQLLIVLLQFSIQPIQCAKLTYAYLLIKQFSI